MQVGGTGTLAGFYSTDFRAIERLGQLIRQVGGRAGRGDRPGRVQIQTRFADHPLLQTLIRDGYAEFGRQILSEREQSALPPYAFQALIRAEAASAGDAAGFLEGLLPGTPSPSVELLGPIPAIMEKRAGRFRQMLIATSQTRGQLHQALAEVIDRAEKSRLASRVRWSVDVDPIDLY